MANATAMELTLGVIRSANELRRLRSEWSRLWEKSTRATPFQSPAWVLPWWDTFGNEELCALTLRTGNRLVGLALMFIRQDEKMPTRRALLLGTGNSDCLDVILAPGFEGQGAPMLLEALERLKSRWDICDFQQLRAGSPLLLVEPPLGWTRRVVQQDVCPVLPLRESEPCPKTTKMLQRATRELKRLKKLGKATVLTAQRDDLERHFDALVQLHAASWNRRGGPGVLADPALQNFHRTAALEFLKRGELRLYSLCLDEKIIASLYGFADARRFYYYLSGAEPELGSFSLGTILIAHAVEDALRSGALEFDFLLGSEAYKYHWGATDRPNFRCVLWRE